MGRTAVGVAVPCGTPAIIRAQAKPPSLQDLAARARADSNDPVAHYNLAAALVKRGRHRDAERPLREAVGIDPQYAPALMLLANVNVSLRSGQLFWVKQGRHILVGQIDTRADETSLLHRRSFLIDPLVEDGQPHRVPVPVAWRGTFDQAFRAYDEGRWTDASAGFQKVIDRTVRPSDSTKVPPAALWFRARCALKLGAYDAAIPDLEWLLRLRMQDSLTERNWNPFAGEELRYILAYVHQQAGRWDEAVSRYQALLELNLGLDGAHTHLAEIYSAQGRWNDAVSERVRAIQSNPDATSLYFNLGATLSGAGRHEEAIASLERYVASYPRESRAFYMIGVGQMSLGHADSARAALTQFLGLAPSRYAEQIDDARRRLGTLGN